MERLGSHSHGMAGMTTEPPFYPEDIPPVPRLGGAIGRHATVACKQGANDLCRDAGCECRCHE